MLSSLLAAYTFSRLKFRFSNFWFGCVMMTMMIPAQVMVVPQYIILKKIHLIDTRVALVCRGVSEVRFYLSDGSVFLEFRENWMKRQKSMGAVRFRHSSGC